MGGGQGVDPLTKSSRHPGAVAKCWRPPYESGRRVSKRLAVWTTLVALVLFQVFIFLVVAKEHLLQLAAGVLCLLQAGMEFVYLVVYLGLGLLHAPHKRVIELGRLLS